MAAAAVIDIDAGDLPGAMLDAAREARRAADAQEVSLVEAVLGWADAHPADGLLDTARYADSEQTLAGEGACTVTEFCLYDLAAALGLSTAAVRSLVGESLELRDRLPRLWSAVRAAKVPVWRARLVARSTIGLPFDGAAFVDRHLDGHLDRAGFALQERLVAEAVARFDPERAAAEAAASADRRHVSIHHDDISPLAGVSYVEAALDLPDALDLEAAVAAGAAGLRGAGSDEPLDVRRALALGELARGVQPALDLARHDAVPPPEPTRAPTTTLPGASDRDHEAPSVGRAARRDAGDAARGAAGACAGPAGSAPRPVTLYLHLSDQVVGGSVDLGLARVENTDRDVLATRVAQWCGRDDTAITVQPVIDLRAALRSRQSEVPDRLAEHVRLRDQTCVFPHCTHRAVPATNDSPRRWDADHIRPLPHGPTSTANLAPLCRAHHRVKTHGAWRYHSPAPGTYVWRNAFRSTHLVDGRGTLDLTDRSRPASHRSADGCCSAEP